MAWQAGRPASLLVGIASGVQELGRQSYVKAHLSVCKQWQEFALLQKKITSEVAKVAVAKQQKKVDIDAKTNFFDAKNVYVWDKKVNINKKIAKKLI